MENITIIGGGPAGLMAAISAAETCDNVHLYEKMPSCGRKLLITGKGRCNVTTAKSSQDWVPLVNPDGRFLYSALSSFDEIQTQHFFESRGVPLKKERGDRIFPQSDRAKDVLDALVKEAVKRGVHIHTNQAVQEILINGEGGYDVVFRDHTIHTRTVIVATGGASYPHTGSDGISYQWAQSLGLKVAPLQPALVPLVAVDAEKTTKPLMGLSLRNVTLSLQNQNGKELYRGFGEMLFTHFGLSGPLVLEASCEACRYWQKHHEPLVVHLDLKPALSYDKLKARILRERDQQTNRMMGNVLESMLPRKMILPFLAKVGISPRKVFNQLTKTEQEALIEQFKDYSVLLKGSRPLAEAIVTAGGVETKELSPQTMMCKSYPGLFFIGEAINLDAPTGGFNLQIAFATGFVAGRGASQYIEEALCL